VTAPQKRRGFLERLGTSLGIREARGEESAPDAPADGSKAPLRGYFANFRKGRKPTASELLEDGPKEQGGEAATKRRGYFENADKQHKRVGTVVSLGSREAAEAGVAAHFAVTHRDPERAEESFRAMLRENPKMALWAAHKHSIAFGEPIGIVTPGLQWEDVRKLLPRDAQKEPLASSPHRFDPLLAGERRRIREQTKRARANEAGERIPTVIGRSLTRLARRIEREVPADPDARERAAYIRKIARGAQERASRDQGHEREQPIEARKKNRAAAYKELEEQLRRRDQARGKMRMRDRNDGGLDR
jgi:hypothetical protein